MHLLFVCTGNICRSPLAERLTRAYVEETGVATRMTASSAGTGAVVGRGMEPSSAVVLRGLGGDPTGFSAQQLTAVMPKAADLVLAMTEEHREAVLRESPGALNRVFLLREAAALLPLLGAEGRPSAGASVVADLNKARGRRVRPPRGEDDVADPMRRPLEVHQEVGQQIADALIPVLEALVASDPRNPPRSVSRGRGA